MQDNYSIILELDIKNLDQKISDYIDALENPLESDILREKYVERAKQINLRLHSKIHKCSMKKVEKSLEKAERNLYVYLLKFI